MTEPIILASGSHTRQMLLQNAGVKFSTCAARIDEDAICASLQHNGAKPQDIADALAQAKARKVSLKEPRALVIGCDQVLDLDGVILSRPRDLADATTQLQGLSGQPHSLHSAIVIYQNAAPQWRHVNTARMQMRDLSSEFIAAYLARNWASIGQSVGCYKLEEEGIRLFLSVDGDYFSILGLPLIELLCYLTHRGALPG